MAPFVLNGDEDFFGHRVVHLIEERPGELPRKRHYIHCDICGDEKLIDGADGDYRQTFINARQDHHIRVLAERLQSLEESVRSHGGNALLPSSPDDDGETLIA